MNGPGSFTGLRIGVTIAKVYAWSFNLKLIPISTLKAYALSNDENKTYVSVIDARRDFVYAGIYDSKYNSILKEQYISVDGLYEKIKELNILLVGDTDIRDIKAISPILNVKKIYEYYKDNEGVNPHTLIPNYLKRVEAEAKLEG
jgi:tRNA threonylcarbamoyl adenosine modification protein YeaZ